MFRTVIIGITCGSAFGLPDVVCTEINGATSYGVVDGVAAYSFGTTICNFGDSPTPYQSDTNQHPLIAQSIYMLKDHQLKQIGLGFVRHTTLPDSGNLCGRSCTLSSDDALGFGCSDTSSSDANGDQAMMGPRTEVNAFHTDFPHPFTSMNQGGDAVYKRVQVDLADISDPDALYFVETQIIAPGEYPYDSANNVSYRRVVFAPGTANAVLLGPTYEQLPAIYALRDHGNGVRTPDESVHIDQVTVNGIGLVNVASRVEYLEDESLYRYDYVIHNQYCVQPFGWIEHTATMNRDAQGLGFSSPVYHGDLDEMVDDQAWTVDLFRGETMLYRQAVGFPDDPNANTIRWGTAYSFSLKTDSQPLQEVEDTITIGWQTAANSGGHPYFLTADAIMPYSGEFICSPDVNGDGLLNFFDVSAFIKNYFDGVDYNGDGVVNFFDVSRFLSDYSEGCP
ncbi:MAG: hypothetical protein JJ916_03670 [Phycisphaerales bacterium]|nr:hypothetical protein [Phycisphaerales bacterium]